MWEWVFPLRVGDNNPLYSVSARNLCYKSLRALAKNAAGRSGQGTELRVLKKRFQFFQFLGWHSSLE